MAETELISRVEAVLQKVAKLVQALKQSRQENRKLQDENQRLQQRVEMLNKKIEELENKNLNLQITRSVESSSADNTAFKQRLDEFIQEIDECIARIKG